MKMFKSQKGLFNNSIIFMIYIYMLKNYFHGFFNILNL
jgi:hypothetical protein